jgi:dTMP kinase
MYMTTLHGHLIVIDGADAAGKTTQTQLLVAALEAQGERVAMFDFPRYQTSSFGKLLREALTGKYGDFLALSPYISSWLYTLDRVSAREELGEALSEGVVVCNRYVPSNIAYQAAKLPPEEREAFIDFLEEAEYDELRLPHPSLVIYLAVPEEVSRELATARAVLDQHEENIAYQREVNAVYRKLAEERDGWHLINCAPEGKLLSREAIHDLVLAVVDEGF